MRTSSCGPAGGPSETPTGPAAASNGAAPKHRPSGGLLHAWRIAGRRLPELRNELSWLAAVQADRARLAVAAVVRRLIFHVLVALTGAAVFAIAAAKLLEGVAGGVAQALGGSVWLANLLTGLVALIGVLLGVVGFERSRSARRLRDLQRRHAHFADRDRALSAATAAAACEHAARN